MLAPPRCIGGPVAARSLAACDFDGEGSLCPDCAACAAIATAAVAARSRVWPVALCGAGCPARLNCLGGREPVASVTGLMPALAERSGGATTVRPGFGGAEMRGGGHAGTGKGAPGGADDSFKGMNGAVGSALASPDALASICICAGTLAPRMILAFRLRTGALNASTPVCVFRSKAHLLPPDEGTNAVGGMVTGGGGRSPICPSSVTTNDEV